MRLTLVALLVAFLSSSALAADAPKGPSTLPAKNGNVTYQHGGKHETLKCDACHPGGAGGKIALTKDTAHKMCVECHKTGGAGPTKCTECHKK